jgi:hypothetical protein
MRVSVLVTPRRHDRGAGEESFTTPKIALVGACANVGTNASITANSGAETPRLYFLKR